MSYVVGDSYGRFSNVRSDRFNSKAFFELILFFEGHAIFLKCNLHFCLHRVVVVLGGVGWVSEWAPTECAKDLNDA